MALNIQQRFSDVSGYIPTTSTLPLRNVGVNTADATLWVNKADSSIARFDPIGPAFGASVTAQDIGSNADEQIRFDTERWTTGDYDFGSYFFYPSIAGLYQFNINLFFTTVNPTLQVVLYATKNGSAYATTATTLPVAMTAMASTGMALSFISDAVVGDTFSARITLIGDKGTIQIGNFDACFLRSI